MLAALLCLSWDPELMCVGVSQAQTQPPPPIRLRPPAKDPENSKRRPSQLQKQTLFSTKCSSPGSRSATVSDHRVIMLSRNNTMSLTQCRGNQCYLESLRKAQKISLVHTRNHPYTLNLLISSKLVMTLLCIYS